MAFPKILYVYEEKSGEERYFVASEDSHDQMEGLVGVYALREKLRVRHKEQFCREGSKRWFDK